MQLGRLLVIALGLWVPIGALIVVAFGVATAGPPLPAPWIADQAERYLADHDSFRDGKTLGWFEP